MSSATRRRGVRDTSLTAEKLALLGHSITSTSCTPLAKQRVFDPEAVTPDSILPGLASFLTSTLMASDSIYSRVHLSDSLLPFMGTTAWCRFASLRRLHP
ncbi:hypothetical protein CALCODRAFT_496898 [Calocera cornea HHB12733]|uniref:Uncharacterized protein n=1 Tax=Calocera cornea HHB12733 TaxID=1353952 RepID=A0A165FKU2_9BASI|nr:hypothetical protein CALCODRAFT_496898 [Calocera cornea HHB12733]